MLTALQNYVRDQHRRESTRSGPRFVPEDAVAIEALEPAAADDPASAFNRQWATATFDSAIRKVEADCRASGMAKQWRAFEARVLLPQTRGVSPVPIEQVITELEARDRQQVYDMIETVKRKVQRAVRELVNETVEDPRDVEAELSTLRSFLAQ